MHRGFHRNFLCNKKSILISKNALNFIIKSIYKGYTFKTTYKNYSHLLHSSLLWLKPRPISNSQLHAIRHFHLCPIYLVLFKGFYSFKRMGYLILGGTSRLDAFSVYSFRTWLPGDAIGMTAGTPVVRPARSSRTKASSPQISYARAG